ncbi:MAG: AAA family ATPase, partial [Prevotella sp.]|nr:AAA family ATPase [Prevotella sp.]
MKDKLVSYVGYCELCKISSSHKADENDQSLEELLDELGNLIGLSKVKDKVYDLIAYQKVQKMRSEHGLNVPKHTLHLAFMGNPGTGKTTVARIIGHLYYKLGLLSKGHFVEVSRTDLIAGYQG